MDGDAPSQPTAQLETEREQFEAVVAEMRDWAEDNVRFQLTQRGLDEGAATGGRGRPFSPGASRTGTPTDARPVSRGV